MLRRRPSSRLGRIVCASILSGHPSLPSIQPSSDGRSKKTAAPTYVLESFMINPIAPFRFRSAIDGEISTRYEGGIGSTQVRHHGCDFVLRTVSPKENQPLELLCFRASSIEIIESGQTIASGDLPCRTDLGCHRTLAALSQKAKQFRIDLIRVRCRDPVRCGGIIDRLSAFDQLG